MGPLPLAAIDANVNVYLGPPLGLAEAPVSLDPPRSKMGTTAASFGVLFAGGQNAEGALDKVEVYSTYMHAMQDGADLPQAVSDPSVAPGTTGFIYILGGTDSDGQPTSQSFAFDTTVPPAGTYRPQRRFGGIAPRSWATDPRGTRLERHNASLRVRLPRL